MWTMAKLIAEGGVAGHLAHLYDNRGLTFEKLAEILTAASRGKLVGTEKTDGFNVYLGFKNGEAKAARNKGDMQKVKSFTTQRLWVPAHLMSSTMIPTS